MKNTIENMTGIAVPGGELAQPVQALINEGLFVPLVDTCSPTRCLHLSWE